MAPEAFAEAVKEEHRRHEDAHDPIGHPLDARLARLSLLEALQLARKLGGVDRADEGVDDLRQFPGLAGRQLARAPALIEGVLEHVGSGARRVEFLTAYQDAAYAKAIVRGGSIQITQNPTSGRTAVVTADVVPAKPAAK